MDLHLSSAAPSADERAAVDAALDALLGERAVNLRLWQRWQDVLESDPELATAEGMGKVSGWGWGFGYFGGMLALGLCLGYVLWAQGRGLPASSSRTSIPTISAIWASSGPIP